MGSELISIVIPVYNTKRERLERCINSVLQQSYKNYEIIIVDDGSETVNRETLISLYEGTEKIRIIKQENQGSGAARNRGVNEAEGSYVMFLDSDDMLTEYALKDAALCVEQYDADLIVGQIHKEREIDWDFSVLNQELLKPIYLNEQKEIDEYINHILGFESSRFVFSDRYFCDGPVAKLCKRRLLLQTRFDTNNFWSEDTIWNLRYTEKCKHIMISNNIWYYAFANEASQTHIFRPNCEYEFKYRINQEKKIVKEIWPQCMDGLYAQIWLSTHYLFACYLLHKDNPEKFRARYTVFLNCIKQPPYLEMLKFISFNDEKIFYKKTIKKMIRSMCLYGPKILAYLGWKMILDSRKGER